MPTYDYQCQKCGFEFEREQRITEDPIKACPKCKSRQAKRLLSAPNFILKGGGWYADGYGSGGGKKDKDKSSSESSSDSSASTSESKSDSTSSPSSDSDSGAKKTASSSEKATTGKKGKSSGKSAA